MKNARGFMIMDAVIAIGIFGVLVAGLAHLSNQSYMQQAFLNDRQTGTGLNLSVVELLSKREACTNSFQGLLATLNHNPAQIRGTDALEIKYQTGQIYGVEGSQFRLAGIRLGDLREVRPSPLPAQGRMTVSLDFVRQNGGFGPPSMPARVDLLVTLSAGNQITSCMAIGRDLNQPWIRSSTGNSVVHFGNNVLALGRMNGVTNPTPPQKLSLIDPAISTAGGYMRATAYYRPSDIRLKDHIENRDGIGDLSQLRGVAFRWRESGRSDLGVVAQEVREVLPEAVSETNGVLTVDSTQLLPSLIEAHKALASRQRELLQMAQAQEEQLRALRLKLKHTR